MANLNLSQFTEKTLVADADWVFVWDTAGAISKKVSRNSLLNSGTLSTSAPVTISQTWDAGTNVMTALKVEVTDTASGTTSNLLSLDMSTNTVLGAKWRFKFEKDGTFWNLGNARLGSGLASAAQLVLGNGFYYFGGGNGINMIGGVAGYILQHGATQLWRGSADHILEQRNSTNPQTFNVYGTYTSGTSYERLTLSAPSAANAIIGTNKGSGGGTARGLEFQTDGVTRMTLASNGLTIGSLNIQPANSAIYNAAIIGFGGNTVYVGSPSDGVLRITNNALNGFNRLQFGGETASFPALKRSSTTLQARLADDSAFAPIQGKLTTDTAFTSGAITDTGYIVLYDSTGTAYKVACTPV
jgi:hypothetical protein